MDAFLFYWSLDPAYVLGVKDQIIGGQLVLRQFSTVPDYSLILWDYNQLTGYLTLAVTAGTPQPLIAAPQNGQVNSQTLLYLSAQNPAAAYKWSFLSSPGFLYNRGATGIVLDNKDRAGRDLNPIWLFTYNGSQAQLWNKVAVPVSERAAAGLTF